MRYADHYIDADDVDRVAAAMGVQYKNPAAPDRGGRENAPPTGLVPVHAHAHQPAGAAALALGLVPKTM